MKTNSKAVRDQIRQHILDCVTDENGDNYESVQAASVRLMSEFDRVANYPFNLKRFPNTQERFSDYLMGLPFAFEYTAHGIASYLNGLGINPEGKEYPTEKSVALYHYLIFAEASKAAGVAA